MPPVPIHSEARIGHVHLKVADLQRALDFYHGVLGLAITLRIGNTWESRGGQPPPPGSTGLYHLALVYPSRATLADALSRLLKANIALEGASDHGVSQALYLRDPDGNGVELYWDQPRENWPRTPTGELTMYTRRLDLSSLLEEASNLCSTPTAGSPSKLP